MTELQSPVVPPVVDESQPSVVAEVVSFRDKVPCNWTVTERIGDDMTAINYSSGETFTGNYKDFRQGFK